MAFGPILGDILGECRPAGNSIKSEGTGILFEGNFQAMGVAV
jgi:hypothetical protein